VLRYGTAKELVAGLEVVLPDGQVWSDLKGLRKDNTGYDLKQLFMGAEGTLGIISAVVLRLQPRPKTLLTAWLEIGELSDAVATLTLLRSQLGDCITSFEYISGQALALVLEHIPGTRNPLTDTSGHYALVELAAFDDGGSLSRDLQSALETAIVNTGVRDVVIAQNETQRRDLWRLRESIPAAEKRAGGSVKHDVSVEIDALGEFVDLTLIALAAEFPASQASVYGHVGDGNVHLNVLAPASVSPQDFKRECAVEVSALIHSIAIARGGSFSAEHGVGRLKRTLLAETADPIALDLMRKIKQALDPKGLMNPGKVI
jgi:FAD/FMN-containing dehydrogenase